MDELINMLTSIKKYIIKNRTFESSYNIILYTIIMMYLNHVALFCKKSIANAYHTFFSARYQIPSIIHHLFIKTKLISTRHMVYATRQPNVHCIWTLSNNPQREVPR